MIKRTFLLPAFLMALLASITGCDEIGKVWKEVMEEPTIKENQRLSNSYKQFLGYYLSSANDWNLKLEQSVSALDDSVQAFLQNPDEKNLALARKQWLDSYYVFQTGQLYYQFASGYPGLDTILYQIDAPISLPGYIDYVQHYPHSGIINDLAINLDPDSLVSQHGLTDPADVVLGFNAIAFVLWGENGNRTADDYIEILDWGGETIDLPVSQHSNNRRRQFLALAVSQLRQDLSLFSGFWQSGGAVHKSITNADNRHVIKIVVSLINATREPRSRQAANANNNEYLFNLNVLKAAAMLEGIDSLVRGDAKQDELNFHSLTLSVDQEEVNRLLSLLDLLDQSVYFENSGQAFSSNDSLPQEAIAGFDSLEQSFYRIAGKLGIHL